MVDVVAAAVDDAAGAESAAGAGTTAAAAAAASAPPIAPLHRTENRCYSSCDRRKRRTRRRKHLAPVLHHPHSRCRCRRGNGRRSVVGVEG